MRDEDEPIDGYQLLETTAFSEPEVTVADVLEIMERARRDYFRRRIVETRDPKLTRFIR